MAAIEMPPYLNSKVFDLNYNQQLSASGTSGFIQTLDRSSPVWLAEYATPALNGDRYNDWNAFFDALEGSIGTFLAYDPQRPMPYAYRTLSIVSDPWTQVGQVAPRVTAQDYANSTITLDRLQTGAIITKGDYISVLIGAIWYLFRAQASYTVVGNGQVVSVKPRPNIVGLVATNIRYRRACIEMKMIGKPEESGRVDDLPSFRFRAGQYTNRIPA
jgi:hypothetical protein